jgi:hypothetical protein
MVNFKAKEQFLKMIDLYIKESFLKGNIKDREFSIRRIKYHTKGIFIRVKRKVKEFTLLIINHTMMDNLSKINLMVRVNLSLKILFMKVIGKRIKNMVKDFMIISME